MTAPNAAPRVELEIVQANQPLGKIVLELDAANAPLTTQNFLRYAEEGYYDGTVFHRVIPTFMIQGGGYTDAGGGEKPGGLRPPIQNEAKNGLKNERGTIAMARTGDPHSATSQFFINVADNNFLNCPGQDGWGYCVFGKVVEGLDVVDKIKGVKTQFNPMMGENSQPVDPPVVRKARRLGS